MRIIKLKNNFIDKRGSITDIFYNKKFKHVSLILSKKNSIRGNNYFKKNTQFIYNLTSDFEYFYKNLLLFSFKINLFFVPPPDRIII